MTLHKFKMITKPFWIPAITLIYYSLTDSINQWVFAALLFGWIGDLLLMRGRKRWFVAGAFSFLIGHLFYIYIFISSAGGFLVFRQHPVLSGIFLLPYIGFLIFFKRMLGRNVSSVLIAAGFYLTVLLLMSYSALLRVWSVTTASFLLTFSGSILFIASDCLIGYRNFKRKFKGIGVVIVVTYIAAQLMIIGGLV